MQSERLAWTTVEADDVFPKEERAMDWPNIGLGE